MNTFPDHYLTLKKSLNWTLKSEQFSGLPSIAVKLCTHQETMLNNDLYAITCNQKKDYSYKVIRPFLSISRNEITRICEHEKIPVYPDKSNQSLKYSRNRIRKQIVPSVQLFLNPRIEDAIFQFAEFVSQEQDFIFSLANITRL